METKEQAQATATKKYWHHMRYCIAFTIFNWTASLLGVIFIIQGHYWRLIGMIAISICSGMMGRKDYEQAKLFERIGKNL